MDKIFMLIILLIIGFWGYLKYSEDSGSWVALHNDSIIGEYSSYTECIDDVKAQIDVSVEVFSCSRD